MFALNGRYIGVYASGEVISGWFVIPSGKTIQFRPETEEWDDYFLRLHINRSVPFTYTLTRDGIHSARVFIGPFIWAQAYDHFKEQQVMIDSTSRM